MKNSTSLKKNSDFRYVYNRGKSIADKNLVLYLLKNNINKNRLGISISKKVGNSVVRNRITRLIKENYRIMEEDLLIGYDMIFIARNSSNNANFYEIGNSMRHLFKKQGVSK